MNLQLQAALALAGIGTALLFIAIRSESTEFLTAKAISTHPRTYSRMWFRDEGSLAGAFREGRRLSIDYWSPEGAIADTLEVTMLGAVADDQPWAIDTLSSRVAWIVGASVYCQMLPAQSANLTIVALGADNALRAVGILSDGSIAVPFADSMIRRWDCATGRPRGESRIALEEPEEAVLEADYLAVSSTQKRALDLYRFREPDSWTLAERSGIPDSPYRLAVPGPGLLVAEAVAEFRLNGKTRDAPGTVRSVLQHGNDFLITGGFDNAFVLPKQGEMYAFAEAPPDSLAAASRSHLALSSERGTTLFQISSASRMSSRGQALSYMSGLLLGASVLLGVVSISEGAILGIFSRRKRPPATVAIETKVRKPPRELVAACAGGECVLWAGAGLSAQAEFPDRTAFVTLLLQAPCVQASVPAPRIAKLRRVALDGDAEAAMESLVLEMSTHRQELLAAVKKIFARTTTASPAHGLLSRIVFGSAITTNYDSLLEQIGKWAGNILSTESDAAVESAHKPFLLKLYGDPALPRTVLLTRSELRAALGHSRIAAFIGRVAQIRTLVFVGCSVEGLLADLAVLDFPRKALSRHYLLTGVTGEKWKKSAGELTRRYGVEVLDFDAATIQTALPKFLSELAQSVEEIRSTRRKPDLVKS